MLQRNVFISISGAQQMFCACRCLHFFLQPSHHLSRSCASIHGKSLAIESHFSSFFHTFFGLPFFGPSTSKCNAFTGPLSSSMLSTCPNYCNIWSLRNSSNLSLFPRHFTNLLMFILSFKVFPHIIWNIFISVVFNFLSSSTLNAQHSGS